MRRPAISLWLCAFAFLAGSIGCDAPRQDMSAGGDDPEEGLLGPPDCDKNGDLTCEGAILKTCLSGRWRVQRTCLSNQVCTPSLGCVQCNPALPTACDGDNIRHCNADGTLGDQVEQCDPGMCKGGSCSDSCGENADLVYLVDEEYRLLSFNPRDGKNELKVIGNLNCPAGPSFDGLPATPFSMSVDRKARAWVLYNSGEIFWVSTKDASCTPSSFVPAQKGFETFGMGFVSDTAGSDAETLYIAGGAHDVEGMGNLGSIDPKTLQVTSIGALPQTEYGPELTGNGKAELWGYFPGVNNTFAAQLDKTSGMTLNRWPMPPLSGSVVAWAFAHWGGQYYLFVTDFDPMTSMNNSQIMLFTPADGHVTTLINYLPYTIVGAGVSTCAPVIIG